MIHDELENYLKALDRQQEYKVIELLKASPTEVTEKVMFYGAGKGSLGPYIRKRISACSTRGNVYQLLFEAQQNGRRFLHIPRIDDYCVIDDEIYVIMEFIKGNTLDEFISDSNLGIDEIRRIFLQICDAIIELHSSFSSPIIHRDIKPSNIIITETNVMLIDFGISRVFSEGLEHDTETLGTKVYSAPEQFGFMQTDERSDIYSLGILLTFMITGQSPSPSLKEKAFLDTKGLSPLKSVLEKSTAFDPENRYKSVAEMRQAFTAAVQQIGEMKLKNNESRKSNLTFSREASNSASIKSNNKLSKYAYKLSQRSFKFFAIIWNFLVFATWILFIAACINLTLFPETDSNFNNVPYIGRNAVYSGLGIVFTVIAWLLIIKRCLPFREKIMRFKMSTRVKFYAIVAGIGLSLTLIATFICKLLKYF